MAKAWVLRWTYGTTVVPSRQHSYMTEVVPFPSASTRILGHTGAEARLSQDCFRGPEGVQFHDMLYKTFRDILYTPARRRVAHSSPVLA